MTLNPTLKIYVLNDNFVGTELDPDLSFAKVAEGCGLKGIQVKTQEELTKADKEALDPEADKKFVKGVGFIEKYIASRNQPNPLQGKPAYAVSTVAGGGLMRTPVYLDAGGMVEGDDDNRRFEGDNVGGSISIEPGESPGESPVESPVVSEEPVTSSGPPSEPNIASSGAFDPDNTKTALREQYGTNVDEEL